MSCESSCVSCESIALLSCFCCERLAKVALSCSLEAETLVEGSELAAPPRQATILELLQHRRLRHWLCRSRCRSRCRWHAEVPQHLVGSSERLLPIVLGEVAPVVSLASAACALSRALPLLSQSARLGLAQARLLLALLAHLTVVAGGCRLLQVVAVVVAGVVANVLLIIYI